MNILICGDSFKSITGLNEIALNIAKFFISKDYNVAYCNIAGDLCTKDNIEKLGIEIEFYNGQLSQGDFDKVIKEFKPHIVFSIHDPWQIDKIVFSQYRDTYKWIHYCPIEGNHYSEYLIYPDDNSFRKSLSAIISDCDLVIPYTQIGQTVLKKLSNKNNIGDYLYNGIEYIDVREVDRNKVFKGLVKDDQFLFMTVGTNFRRKGLDYIVEAFHLFLQSVDNPENYKLYIHGNLNTVNSATDIKSMVRDLNLLDNIIYSSHKPLSKYELYERYKCADCYIGLPLAEGFGLGFAEAMLNKVPIIAHDYGGQIEYIKEYQKVSSCANYYPNNYFSLWKIPDIQDAVQAMKNIVKDNHDYITENYLFAKRYLVWERIFQKLNYIFIDFIKDYKEDIIHSLQLRRVI